MTPTLQSTAASATPPLTADTPMATIALRSDAHAAVLDRHRLDFCCGGQLSLAEACGAAGVDVRLILSELHDAAVSRLASAVPREDWSERPLTELVEHIVETHHAFTRGALARISALTKKVFAHHGERHPELARVSVAFFNLASDLMPHMAREEGVLFPYIRALADPKGAPPPHFRTVRNPVRVMMMEHDHAAELLSEIKDASADFKAPADACGSYFALYAALAELRFDLLKHVSLENNLLFPRAIALEDALLRGATGAA